MTRQVGIFGGIALVASLALLGPACGNPTRSVAAGADRVAQRPTPAPVVDAAPPAPPPATPDAAPPEPPPPPPPPPRSVAFTSPSGAVETCHLLMPFPVLPPDVDPTIDVRTWYRADDVEDVAELCTLDPWGNEPDHAMCPKLHFNTPALEFFDVQASGLDRKTYEAERCSAWRRRKDKKVAKLKVAVYAREAEAGLMYFHFARLLGNIANVPTAAARTVGRKDLAVVASRALTAIARLRADSMPRDGWQVLVSRHKKADPSAVMLGSLAENPRGETNHPALSHPPGGGGFIGAPSGYTGHRYYQIATNPRPIAELLPMPSRPAAYRKALQQLAYVVDFTSLTLLDHLFNQRDRPGNIGGRKYAHFVDGTGALVWKKQLDADDAPAGGSVELMRLLLKDNDDALLWTKFRTMNFTKFIGLIRHLERTTYDRMQWLAAAMTDPASADAIRAYFQDDVGISTETYDAVLARFVKMAGQFKALYDAGKLQLDLDLAAAIAAMPADR